MRSQCDLLTNECLVHLIAEQIITVFIKILKKIIMRSKLIIYSGIDHELKIVMLQPHVISDKSIFIEPNINVSLMTKKFIIIIGCSVVEKGLNLLSNDDCLSQSLCLQEAFSLVLHS